MSSGHKHPRDPETGHSGPLYKHLKQYDTGATQRLQRLISNPTQDLATLQEIQTLIEVQGANPNIQGSGGMTPLMFIVGLPQDNTNSPFNIHLLQTFIFLMSRFDIDLSVANNNGDMLIHMAVKATRHVYFHFLLGNAFVRRNIDVLNSRGLSPLHIACENMVSVSIKHIKSLLKAGADPNAHTRFQGLTPLQVLIGRYSFREANMDDLAVILHAFFQCPATRLGYLDLKDHRGDTLLHYAVKYIHSANIINMLIENGEFRSLQVQNYDYQTPLQKARSAGNTEAIDAIQKYTAARRP